jgi:hypothetical protein
MSGRELVGMCDSAVEVGLRDEGRYRSRGVDRVGDQQVQASSGEG